MPCIPLVGRGPSMASRSFFAKFSFTPASRLNSVVGPQALAFILCEFMLVIKERTDPLKFCIA